MEPVTIKYGEVQLKITSSKKVLGVVLDSSLSFKDHVQEKTKAGFAALRGIDGFVVEHRWCSQSVYMILQGSKKALIRSYLRVPQAAGQVKILIFLVKFNFFPIYANIFGDAGQVPIFRYFEACIVQGFSLASYRVWSLGDSISFT